MTNAEGTPEHLEYKDTRGTVLGYTAAPVPHISRVGAELTEEERKRGDGVVGSPAQGNAIQNEALQPVGGLTTDSGGTQTAPAPSTASTRKRTGES